VKQGAARSRSPSAIATPTHVAQRLGIAWSLLLGWNEELERQQRPERAESYCAG